MSIKHAIILAAGRGIRMMPLTKKIPKPLLKYKNEALILNGLKKVKKFIKNVHITVGYKGSMLAKCVIENNVSSVINTNDKGNAWWIFQFPFKYLDEPVFVLTCDNVTSINFKQIEKDYILQKKPACLLVPVDPIDGLEGDYIESKKNFVISLSRKKQTNIYCSGIQVINPKKVNKLIRKKVHKFDQVWKLLIKKKQVKVSNVKPKKWFAVDSKEQLLRLRNIKI